MDNSISGKIKGNNYSSRDIEVISKTISEVKIMGKYGWTIGEFVGGGGQADVFFLNHNSEEQKKYVVKLFYCFSQIDSPADENERDKIKRKLTEKVAEIKIAILLMC